MSLERAIELLDAMERRHQDRLKRGDLGELQTELNECRRCLVEILEHLKPRPRFVYRPENEPTDYHDSLGHIRHDNGDKGL